MLQDNFGLTDLTDGSIEGKKGNSLDALSKSKRSLHLAVIEFTR